MSVNGCRTPSNSASASEFDHAFTQMECQAASAAAVPSGTSSSSQLLDSTAGTPHSSISHAPYTSLFITPSTFDPPSQRHSLVGDNGHVRGTVSGVGFGFHPATPSWSNRRPSSSPVVEEDVGDGSDSIGSEEEDEEDGRYQSETQRTVFSSSGSGTIGRINGDYGRAARYNSSGGTNSARVPLLSGAFSGSSPLDRAGSSTSSSLPNSPYIHPAHFTPGSRRTFLQHKIDLAKLQRERNRKAFLCWKRNPFTRKGLLLAAAIAGLVVSYACELILRKSVATNMYPYRWFVFQSVCFCTFLCTILAAIQHRVSVIHFVKHHGVPYKFLILSSLVDAIHGLALILAIGVLPLEWGILLCQVTIPFSLLFRFFVTNGERCGWTGLVGSCMILAGCIISIVPSLIDFSCPHEESESSEERQRLIVYSLILLIGLIPAGVSHIYKQSFLQHHSMDRWFMALALATMELFWGMILAPIVLGLQGRNLSDWDKVKISEAHGSVAITPVSSSSTNPALPTPASADSQDLSDFTSDMGGNVWRNGKQAIGCLFGKEVEQGDGCKDLYPVLGIEFILFFLCMLCTQLLLAWIMRRVKTESYTSCMLAGGVTLALVLSQPSPIIDLLPPWDIGRCLPAIRWITISGAVVLVLGMIVGQLQPSQEPMDLDVWARLEEFTLEEDLEQLRRAKLMSLTNAVQHKPPSNKHQLPIAHAAAK